MADHNQRIEAVIFDLDDTLIDWARPAVTWEEYNRSKSEAIHQHLLAAGHTLPPYDAFHEAVIAQLRRTWEEAKKTWEIVSFEAVLRHVFAGLGLNVEAIDMQELLQVYSWGPFPGVILYEDTIPVLQELRRRGYKIGLLTNSIFPMWMRDVELHAYELMDYFDARVTSGDVGYLKPHPEIFRHILELLQVSPEQAVFVGDRPENDIAGANEAGLISVLLAPPHLNRDLNGVKPDFTITSLTQLLTLLEELEKVSGIKYQMPGEGALARPKSIS